MAPPGTDFDVSFWRDVQAGARAPGDLRRVQALCKSRAMRRHAAGSARPAPLTSLLQRLLCSEHMVGLLCAGVLARSVAAVL